MAGFSIAIEGKDAALAALAAAVNNLDHPFPMFDAIGAAMVTSTTMRFETEKDPEGNPWPASARALADGGKTLTDTTYLRGSISHEASDAGVAWGTNVIYAAIHQTGGTIKARDGGKLRFPIDGGFAIVASVEMPRRAFLGLDVEDELTIADIAGEFVLEPVGGADAF